MNHTAKTVLTKARERSGRKHLPLPRSWQREVTTKALQGVLLSVAAGDDAGDLRVALMVRVSWLLSRS